MLWGIDLGGTKIEGAVVDPSDGAILLRRRIATEQEGGYEHIVRRVGLLVRIMEEETGTTRPARIGIGTPGAFDPHLQAMKNCNTTCLNGRDLPSDLQAELGVEVRMANDANCFALAEALHGSARGSETVFGVILGTGVGGGIVAHGRVLNGCHGIAGEWGHNVLHENGEPCYCGKRGCVEKYLSGPGVERQYFERTGRRLTCAEIAARASTDPEARRAIDRLCKDFGRALAVVIDILDPHAIVLGGGVGNIAELYTQGREAVLPWLFNPRLDAPILRPALGDSAGVLGAALLCAPGA
ncbi:MAG: ROK family protein [Fimbriimonadales bacterium]|nr:ROK family protein [Fimbriimonadales bacterium]